MAPPLTPTQTSIIQSTVPVLASQGLPITKKFYADLLTTHPSLRNIFNHTDQITGHQPLALATALHAYAANITDLGTLSPAVELICQKHASLGIEPAQYAVVGEGLLKTMREVLGREVFTEEVEAAWGAAYWQLADIMIGREKELYASAGEWTGWRGFRISKKQEESSEITSFYLSPEDGKCLPKFKPGQYVSVRVRVEALGGLWQARQYSLSERPREEGDWLRVSVKREDGVDMRDPESVRHPGYVSNLLHGMRIGDSLEVSHPFGDFYFDEEEEGSAPVVLISAGVGLTCLTSILNALVEKESKRPISWIHGARNSAVRAFREHVDEVVRTHENVHALFFDTVPTKEEVLGRDYHVQGRIGLEKVDKEKDLYVQNQATRYFVCGPTQFMLDTEKKLVEYGVEKERIHLELFGTGGVPRA